ncbi:MAG: hypothetical protein IJD68_02995 [Ruminococcus sp.]|nr:hypothetical protein [Ruminococcus sp.]
MATTKKTTTTTEKKTTTKKAAAPKATTAKKAAAPKATAEKKAPAKKAPAKKTTAKVDLYIQFGGATVAVADIEKNVKKVVKGKKAYTVYVKPEESKAYIVADGETTGMDVFFCE